MKPQIGAANGISPTPHQETALEHKTAPRSFATMRSKKTIIVVALSFVRVVVVRPPRTRPNGGYHCRIREQIAGDPPPPRGAASFASPPLLFAQLCSARKLLWRPLLSRSVVMRDHPANPRAFAYHQRRCRSAAVQPAAVATPPIIAARYNAPFSLSWYLRRRAHARAPRGGRWKLVGEKRSRVATVE